MKVAIVGGGGFRTPTLHACLSEAVDRVDVEEVVLHDVDAERLASILAVIHGMERERGGSTLAVRTTTSLDDAVENAGAVLIAIRVGGLAARVIDEAVPLELGVLGQETVGPGGIAFALRTIPAVRSIASLVRDRAPGAWIVNFTNPAGIVTESIREVAGDRVVGICDSPTALSGHVAAALGGRVRSFRFDHAGLNHLGWLLGVDDGDHDLLPELLADEVRLPRVEEARRCGTERVRSLGAIPNEYLVYLERAAEVTGALQRDGSRASILADQQGGFFAEPPGDPASALARWRRVRDRRHGTYMAEAPDLVATEPADVEPAEPDPDAPGDRGYAAIAVDFLEATSGAPRSIVLDTANRGRLDEVGDDEVVEVTCDVDRDGIRPIPGRRLPSEAAELVVRIKEVERLTRRASDAGSAALALDAIAAHPVVPSRDVAKRILDGYLTRHHDLRGSLR
jgi:6-phospho-beta-glucosidase